MNISALIERLQEIAHNEGDLEVRIAYQPHYPLQVTAAGVATHNDLVTLDWAMNEGVDPGDEVFPIAWIVTGSPPEHGSPGAHEHLQDLRGNPYADARLWDAANASC